MKIKSLVLTIALLSTVSVQAMFRSGVQRLLNISGKRLVHNNQPKNLEKLSQKCEKIIETNNSAIRLSKLATIISRSALGLVIYSAAMHLDSNDAITEKLYELNVLPKDSDYISLQKRLNAPRYTESKVSPADVSLGGLIDQW